MNLRKWIKLAEITVISSALLARLVGAAEPIMGVNVVAVDQASQKDRDALIEQLGKYGVKTIRTALGGRDSQYRVFVINAFQHGIGAVVLVDPFAGNTQQHALAPDAAAGRPWGLPALSDADPDGFARVFSAQLDTLEAAGIKVTAFEFGNELSTPRFNADFRPEQKTGRMLEVTDLNNAGDAEASTVAAGFRAYLKVMAKLKDLRDHSKLNFKTPSLAGMSAVGFKAYPRSPGTTLPDTVGIAESIDFLRQNGLDNLADGYAVHAYQSDDHKLSMADRATLLQQTGVITDCKASKPCWITEWGFNNASHSCPLDDASRMAPIQDERGAFKQFVGQGRIASILYCSWSGVLPFSWVHGANPREDPGSIYRCGSLTDAGKLALSPL